MDRTDDELLADEILGRGVLSRGDTDNGLIIIYDPLTGETTFHYEGYWEL